jgi:MscS family membrane protein
MSALILFVLGKSMKLITRMTAKKVMLVICIIVRAATYSYANYGATDMLVQNTDHLNDTAEMPLKAFDWVDTRSPRKTLESFLLGTQRYYYLIHENGYTRENWRELSNIIEQAERLFDLRMVPAGHRRDVAHETTALIREAIARVPLPNLDDVPDENEMAARIMSGKSSVYRVPNTPFEISRTDSGPDTGRYQFAQKSVDQARTFYEEIKSYPYHPDQLHVEGLYEAYFLSPGPIIPRKWIEALPGWLQVEFIGNRAWQLLAVLFILIFYITGIFALHLLLEKLSRDWTELRRSLIFLLRPLAAIILVWGFNWFVIHQIRLTGDMARMVEFGKHLIVLFASVVITVVSGKALADFIVVSRHFAYKQLDQQLVRLFVRLISVVIAAVIIIEVMQQLGFSLATLLAGASVGGLAVGLAAQDTLKNIFGGIELSLDKPFDVGQRVKIKGYDAKIEEIGLRSTKLRTRAGHQINIPNQEVAKLDIENIGRRPNIRRKFNVTITYDTPPGKIERALEILREILAIPKEHDLGTDAPENEGSSNSKLHPNMAINHVNYPPLVYFSELNADSLNLLVYYWYHPPNYWEYLKHATWINMQIIKRFNAEDIDFAFPTQTLHLAGDDKRPLNVGSR